MEYVLDVGQLFFSTYPLLDQRETRHLCCYLGAELITAAGLPNRAWPRVSVHFNEAFWYLCYSEVNPKGNEPTSDEGRWWRGMTREYGRYGNYILT